MNLLYKIHAGYDGFRPGRIPERMLPGQVLRLGWKRYIDAVDPGEEVWVYFHGGRFPKGVYAKGRIRGVDPGDQAVFLRVLEYSTSEPLTDPATTARVAQAVATRYQQVFLVPEAWETAAHCNLESEASSCLARRCGECGTWRAIPRIGFEDYRLPSRFPGEPDEFIPAYWVIPSRCYLWSSTRPIAPGVRLSSEIFYRLKTGEKSVAYTLALGMHESLARGGDPSSV